MFGVINPPRRARGERRLGLIKRSVWEIKLKISHKIRGRGCSCCQARGRAGPAPPLPGCHRRCPRTCRGAVPRSIPAGADSRCQGEGKGGDTPQEKGSTCSPSKPRRAWGGLEVSGARCSSGDWGAAVPRKGGGNCGTGAPNRQPNSCWGDSASPPAALWLCAGTGFPGDSRVPTRRGVMPTLALPTHPARHMALHPVLYSYRQICL